jgi:hypothetical protein
VIAWGGKVFRLTYRLIPYIYSVLPELEHILEVSFYCKFIISAATASLLLAVSTLDTASSLFLVSLELLNFRIKIYF